ncbi:A disintegrin and metalloproteinase with thrombospondin motifs 7 isoform X2 [Bombina bombina]|uniref:A disintegrin and metalloproteinase with thrombospondin motifs 7 isoform X2 n=1 Tax=Bombina bombina TaxID=8345 RepID=UPI00235A800D|nr:A disintegrin and metalloproteinase with thrombospondin motifs 7 isoform X2 [Bombina bombina]
MTPEPWLLLTSKMLLPLVLFCIVPLDVAPLVSDLPLSFSLESDIVHPIRVDEHGSFLTFDLSPRIVKKRGVSHHKPTSTFYEISFQGMELTFNLSQNNQLLAPGYVTEWRSGGIQEARIQSKQHSPCHLMGNVQTENQFVGNAAISICNGLRGVFQMEHDDFMIEPVLTSVGSGEAMPHRIYRRHAAEPNIEEKAGNMSCGVKDNPNSQEKWERRRERWEQAKQRERRIRPRSISKEKWVETLVVADKKMVEYHGRDQVENYVLTIMNMVAGLFHDASIGNRINIVIVRLILLESEEEDLKITHHADNTLRSFCKWQKGVNMKGENQPLHHDVAVLLTRKDLCAAMNRPCETLGLSHVSGMCQPHRSCNINEDTGLPTAFTVTHELGHSFGVQHDGSGNDCEPQGKRPHIMSPQMLYDTSPLTWSHCSRDYITRFLDRGWGLCLDDPPSKELLNFPSVPPGVLYDLGHQCRLQYGAQSSFCQDIDDVCNTLWCSVGSTCHSKLDAAVDGTTCGENKWCFNGDCVPVGHRHEPVDGMWSSWSMWSSCTRTCGAGVQSAERQCNSPTPKYGGRYCLGERKRFRLCNIGACLLDTPSFRHLQCAQFNPVPYRGKQHRWSPVYNSINPCELHCRADGEYFSEKLLDAVIDGTPCYEGNRSRDLCINGICKNVGCDYEIDSNAVEDRCGVCHGDASSCHTVSKTFEDSDGLGYVDIGLIPPGAREIRIEEVAEAGNFLALRSEDPETYFLNGKWTIQWNGDYQAAGTIFTYTRTGNLENLTAPGPTYEPVWIQLLFQEKNPGVRYQYTVRRDADSSNEIQPPDFSWRYGSWTGCSATCGTGIQRQLVHCVEKLAGLVEERYCDFLTRPDDKQRNCNEEPCPPRWWVGEWQQCTTTCGPNGQQKRTVLCIQRVGLDEQRALQPTECQHIPKPEANIPCNHNVLCPAVWHQGNWSQCSASCGEGVQLRNVYCINGTEQMVCDPSERPDTKRTCQLTSCQPQIFSTIDWTGSGGSSKEINEILLDKLQIPSGFLHSQEDNTISEADFSSHGEGGQAKDGRAIVDDFYYDYNFINFHEDLSYDPLEDNDIKLGSKLEPQGKELLTQVPPTEKELEKKNERQDDRSTEPIKDITATPQNPAVTRPMDIFIVSGQHQTPSNSISTIAKTVIKNILTPSTEATLLVTDPANITILSHPDKDQKGLVKSNKATTQWYQNQLIPTTESISSEISPTLLISNFPDISIYRISQDPSLELAEDGLPHAISDAPQDVVHLATEQSLPNSHSGLALLSSAEPTENPTSYPTAGSLPVPPQYILPYPAPGSSTDLSHRSLPYSTLNPSLDPAHALVTYSATDSSQDHKNDDLLTESSLQENVSEIQVEDYTLPLPHDLTANKKNVATTQDLSPDLLRHFPSSIIENAKIPNVDITTALPEDLLYNLPSTLSELDNMVHIVPYATSSVNTVSVNAQLLNVKMEGGSLTDVSATNTGESTSTITASTITTSTAPITWQQLPSLESKESQKSYWEVGNWSECSTSCGLGAMWRSVSCKAENKDYCDPETKPAPARRCYLRPCASWTVGNWSKCSKSCGAGIKMRDVQCVDTRGKKLLRPFHCQNTSYKPLAQIPCYEQQCMEWYVSSWRECSEECGGGMQHRLVTCPQTGQCNENLKPNSSRSCNEHPCTTWAVGPWGQATPASVTDSPSDSVTY